MLTGVTMWLLYVFMHWANVRPLTQDRQVSLMTVCLPCSHCMYHSMYMYVYYFTYVLGIFILGMYIRTYVHVVPCAVCVSDASVYFVSRGGWFSVCFYTLHFVLCLCMYVCTSIL